MRGDEAYLNMPLPEDILKMKWAGDLEAAIRAIEKRLACEIPKALRERLRWEKEIIQRLPTQYPYDCEAALETMRKAIPDFTLAELTELETDGKVDFIYLNGEKRYFIRFHKNLLRFPELSVRAGETVSAFSQWLDPLIEQIKADGSLTKNIRLKASITLEEANFIKGETYLVHMPIPANAPQVTDVVVAFPGFTPKHIDSMDAWQRTAVFEQTLSKNHAFEATYSFTETIHYADLTRPAPPAPLYPNAPAVSAQDLAEEGSCIRFTPYLRALTQAVTEKAASPLEKVRKIYDFVTMKVAYAFVRDYFQIDHLGEYAAINLKGDCGIQALLFINMCRIAGVPARWQSGQVISQTYIGSHDWAQFYLEGWGWLFADCSFGGSAYRNGNEERRLFYFGNLEPLRIVYNRGYQKPFEIDKKHLRIDPYDNQSGEMECLQKGFNGREVDCDTSEIK